MKIFGIAVAPMYLITIFLLLMLVSFASISLSAFPYAFVAAVIICYLPNFFL